MIWWFRGLSLVELLRWCGGVLGACGVPQRLRGSLGCGGARSPGFAGVGVAARGFRRRILGLAHRRCSRLLMRFSGHSYLPPATIRVPATPFHLSGDAFSSLRRRFEFRRRLFTSPASFRVPGLPDSSSGFTDSIGSVAARSVPLGECATAISDGGSDSYHRRRSSSRRSILAPRRFLFRGCAVPCVGSGVPPAGAQTSGELFSGADSCAAASASGDGAASISVVNALERGSARGFKNGLASCGLVRLVSRRVFISPRIRFLLSIGMCSDSNFSATGPINEPLVVSKCLNSIFGPSRLLLAHLLNSRIINGVLVGISWTADEGVASTYIGSPEGRVQIRGLLGPARMCFLDFQFTSSSL